MRFLTLLISCVAAVSCVTLDIPLAPLPLLPESSLRAQLRSYQIAGAPTYWMEGIETLLVVQSSDVDLTGAKIEWSFDDSHVKIISDETKAEVYTTVENYNGAGKDAIVTCWVTPVGGSRERRRAKMSILPTPKHDTTTPAISSSTPTKDIISSPAIDVKPTTNPPHQDSSTTPVAIETTTSTTPVVIETTTTTPLVIETTTTRPLVIETTTTTPLVIETTTITTTTPVLIETTTSTTTTTTPATTDTPLVLE